MKQKNKGVLSNIKNSCLTLIELMKPPEHVITHRVISIEQNTSEEYYAQIQITGKSTTFKMRPEDILANDQLTNQFSPCDIRTLTYLGYLGINSPKYKILAKRLSKDNDKILFAIHKKGSSTVETKTADQISSDKEILNSLDQKDAHMVGFTTATEQNISEEKQKLKLLSERKKKSKPK